MKKIIKKVVPILLSSALITPVFANPTPLVTFEHSISKNNNFSASDFGLNPEVYTNFKYEEKKLKNNTSVQITTYIKDGVKNKLEDYNLGNGNYKTIVYVDGKEVFNENRKVNSYVNPKSTWFDYEQISSGKGFVGRIPDFSSEASLAAAVAGFVGAGSSALFLSVAGYIMNKAQDNPFNDLYMTYGRYHAYEDFGSGNPAMFYTKFKMNFYKDSSYKQGVYTNVEKIFKSTSGWM